MEDIRTVLSLVGSVGALVLAVLGWSLSRNVNAVDKISEEHKASITKLDERIRELEKHGEVAKLREELGHKLDSLHKMLTVMAQDVAVLKDRVHDRP